ncbi:hypothetical protein [Polyangium sp. 15x6]|uniref:hypothetical protein n=1 Tax=Polyangium sp. 15x6 TaxID=3042687 RepID=UPI00249A9827|nr:hypothetical protein [Polyangium sp. 15x6]MDI3286273.1 hypothetical protein [Polyangium sp. 15x6]
MSKSKRLLPALPLFALVLSACGAGPLAYVQDHPASELSCPREKLTYERMGETGLIYASGCGEIVRYVAQCNPNGLCVGETHVVVSRGLRRQAGFDLQCNDTIELTRLGQDTFGATGCGRRASYALLNCGANECTIVQNTQTQ